MNYDTSGVTTTDWTLLVMDQAGSFSCVALGATGDPPVTPPTNLAASAN